MKRSVFILNADKLSNLDIIFFGKSVEDAKDIKILYCKLNNYQTTNRFVVKNNTNNSNCENIITEQYYLENIVKLRVCCHPTWSCLLFCLSYSNNGLAFHVLSIKSC